jgi:Cytochrome c7 and related cytochrome c
MSIKKFGLMLLNAMSLAALLNGCGSDSKAGSGSVAAGNVAKVSEVACKVCHATSTDPLSGRNILQDFLASPHNTAAAGCQGCHGGGAEHNGIGPIPFPTPLDRCKECHNGTTVLGVDLVTLGSAAITEHHTGTFFPSAGGADKCGTCHNPHNPLGHFVGGSCVACHSFPQDRTAKGSFVNDNSGVRAIIGEFSKRSHHITGAAPTDAQCAVCHLEGKVVNGAVVVDTAKHMVDARIHLRNADDNSDMQWSGSEHTVMDNFCFSCHDSNGATGLAGAGLNAITTGTATNPFGDTLTNGYDQVARSGVVDVKTAFTTTNASHHAVSGQRYKYRFSTRANAAVWVARDPAHRTMPRANEIAEGHVDLDGNPIDVFDPAETMAGEFGLPTNQLAAGGFSAPAGEGEATLFEGEKFVKTYTPLGASQTVGDNSTLHCGDCHTVGQWKPGSSTNADGSATTVAIGAHGSTNEYLLRNSLGTDAIHNSLTYVCFNCHISGIAVGLTPGKAGFGLLHPAQNKNQVMGYATAHAVSAFHIQCLADSADNIGAVNRLAGSWEGDKVEVYDYIPALGATATAPKVTGSTDPFLEGTDANSGNITGIACTNCHNSALRSSFGGIHGGDNAYIDGLGRTQKSYRFMPGMGNYRYAPPGGWDGKDVSDPTLVTQAASGVGAGKPMGGCYTNSSLTGADSNPGFGACNHHGTSTAQTTAGGQAAGFRTSYGGGTTATPTATEPTVREATAGNALVTRPLKY